MRMRAVVLALAVLPALTGCAAGTPKPLPPVTVAVTVTATPTATAPNPVTFIQGSPEYQQLLACLFKAGYNESYTSEDDPPILHMTAKGAKGKLPEIKFVVATGITPRTITPQAGRDTVLLHTAGCL